MCFYIKEENRTEWEHIIRKPTLSLQRRLRNGIEISPQKKFKDKGEGRGEGWTCKQITIVQCNQSFSRRKEVSTEPAGCIEKGKINSVVWHQHSLALEEMLGPEECGFARWVTG